MPGIGPGLGDRIDEAGSCASIGGIVRVIRHLKFLDRLLAENVRHARPAPRVAEIVAVSIGPVQREGV